MSCFDNLTPLVCQIQIFCINEIVSLKIHAFNDGNLPDEYNFARNVPYNSNLAQIKLYFAVGTNRTNRAIIGGSMFTWCRKYLPQGTVNTCITERIHTI